MDSYDEASSNFSKAYGDEATYEMAIQIYEAYLGHDMEADGTKYLEASLKTEAKTAEDYCERGKVYYYMEDYDNARTELNAAADKNSTEAVLLLGMVYMAQGDTAGARSFFQQYIEADGEDPAKGYNGLALCDIADGSYDSALENISMHSLTPPPQPAVKNPSSQTPGSICSSYSDSHKQMSYLVDTHHHVDAAQAQVLDDLHALEGVHLVVHTITYSDVQIPVGKPWVEGTLLSHRIIVCSWGWAGSL